MGNCSEKLGGIEIFLLVVSVPVRNSHCFGTGFVQNVNSK